MVCCTLLSLCLPLFLASLGWFGLSACMRLLGSLTHGFIYALSASLMYAAHFSPFLHLTPARTHMRFLCVFVDFLFFAATPHFGFSHLPLLHAAASHLIPHISYGSSPTTCITSSFSPLIFPLYYLCLPVCSMHIASYTTSIVACTLIFLSLSPLTTYSFSSYFFCAFIPLLFLFLPLYVFLLRASRSFILHIYAYFLHFHIWLGCSAATCLPVSLLHTHTHMGLGLHTQFLHTCTSSTHCTHLSLPLCLCLFLFLCTAFLYTPCTSIFLAFCICKAFSHTPAFSPHHTTAPLVFSFGSAYLLHSHTGSLSLPVEFSLTLDLLPHTHRWDWLHTALPWVLSLSFTSL